MSPPARPLRHSLLILGLVMLVVWGLSQAVWQGWGDPQAPGVWRGLLSADGAIAAALCLFSYVLRGQRWRLWVAACGHPTTRRQGLRVYLAGYSLTPTPGNLGEAARGLLMRPQPLPTATSVAVFAAERWQDLLGLVLLALPAFAWAPFELPWPVVLVLGLLVLTLMWLSAQNRAWRGVLRLVPEKVQRVLGLVQAQQCLQHRPGLTWGLTGLAWSAQGLAVWLMCRHHALPIDIVGVVSNHMTYQKVVVNHDLPFHCIKVTKENKPQAEAQLMAVVEETGAELVVLARYMQVLSDALCQKMSGRIINIHHSFLPSFKGANPYKQAYERGVKLIGATAHYVTADLDEGPIIEQDTVRITHAQSPDDYVSLGRDVEAQVLARAIHAHIHHRVFQNGNKTVVFPASPGSYASERMG
mgnify:CR=1 FL=1